MWEGKIHNKQFLGLFLIRNGSWWHIILEIIFIYLFINFTLKHYMLQTLGSSFSRSMRKQFCSYPDKNNNCNIFTFQLLMTYQKCQLALASFYQAALENVYSHFVRFSFNTVKNHHSHFTSEVDFYNSPSFSCFSLTYIFRKIIAC